MGLEERFALRNPLKLERTAGFIATQMIRSSGTGFPPGSQGLPLMDPRLARAGPYPSREPLGDRSRVFIEKPTERGMSYLRFKLLLRLLLPLSFLLSACSDTSSPNDDSLETDLTDPQAVIEAHTKALREKNLEDYAAFLDHDFKFTVTAIVAEDIPWLDGRSWDRATELNMLSRMFDQNYQGREKPVLQANVFVIFEQTHEMQTGYREICYLFDGEMLTGQNEGWAFSSELVYRMLQRDGFWRILEIEETSGGCGRARCEETSLGYLKSFYHDPPLL